MIEHGRIQIDGNLILACYEDSDINYQCELNLYISAYSKREDIIGNKYWYCDECLAIGKDNKKDFMLKLWKLAMGNKEDPGA